MILNNCSICIDNIYLSKKGDQDFYILPCKHIFHKNCILEWFGTAYVFECPNCRSIVNEELIKFKKIKNSLFKSLKWYRKYENLQKLSEGLYLQFLIENFENKKLEKCFKYILFKQLVPNKAAFDIYINSCILFKNNKAMEIFVEYMPLQFQYNNEFSNCKC